MLANIVSGVLAIGFGMAIAIGSWSLGVGRLSQPGVGLFSFVAGLGICLVAVIILFQGRSVARDDAAPVTAEPWSWRGLLVPVVLWAYVEAMPWLGFAISTCLLMTLLFRIAGVRKWSSAFVFGVGSGMAAELGFVVLLGMKLPRGLVLA